MESAASQPVPALSAAPRPLCLAHSIRLPFAARSPRHCCRQRQQHARNGAQPFAASPRYPPRRLRVCAFTSCSNLLVLQHTGPLQVHVFSPMGCAARIGCLAEAALQLRMHVMRASNRLSLRRSRNRRLHVTKLITNSIPLSFHTSLDSLILFLLVFSVVSLDTPDPPLHSCLFFFAANSELEPSMRCRTNRSAFQPPPAPFRRFGEAIGGAANI